jgi:hypothetical protein
MKSLSTSKLWFIKRLRSQPCRKALRSKRYLALQPSGNLELDELFAEKTELEGHLALLDAETSRTTVLLNLIEMQIQEVRVENQTSTDQVLREGLPLA